MFRYFQNQFFGGLAAGVTARPNLYRNELPSIPVETALLTALEVLICANNRLSTLPEGFGVLSRLRTLDLGHKQINELPQAFGKLTSLADYLYLHDNRLRALGDFVFENLAQLRYLNLGDNPLESLPAPIGTLAKLEELRLENIGLETLPGWIGGLGRLDELALRSRRCPNHWPASTT